MFLISHFIRRHLFVQKKQREEISQGAKNNFEHFKQNNFEG